MSRPIKTADVHPHSGFNKWLALLITRAVGSMWTFYLVAAFQFGWMGLATWGLLHHFDPYPFAFLLFMGNVAQLLLMFVLLVGQNVQQAQADAKSEQDHAMLTEILTKLR